ncbi:unnamed protein product, partial [Amoebophrya sp. A25]
VGEQAEAEVTRQEREIEASSQADNPDMKRSRAPPPHSSLEVTDDSASSDVLRVPSLERIPEEPSLLDRSSVVHEASTAVLPGVGAPSDEATSPSFKSSTHVVVVNLTQPQHHQLPQHQLPELQQNP